MKKKVSITRTAVYMVVIQAVIVVLAGLIVSMVFFARIGSEIYDDMNASITGAVIGSVDQGEMEELAREVADVISSKGSFPEDYESAKEEWLKDFESIQESDRYKTLWDEINTMRKRTHATALDYVLIYPEEGIEVFILDACDVNVLPCGEFHRIDTDYYLDQPVEDFDGFVTRSSTYGRLRTDGQAVFLDTEKGIYAYLLSDIPVRHLYTRGAAFLLQTALVALILIVFICMGVVILLKKKVVRPIRDLSDSAERFVGNYELRYGSRETGTVFEGLKDCNIMELCNMEDSLQSMELEIDSYLKDLDHMSAERARIDTELDLARRIQAGVLSTEFDTIKERGNIDIFATMAPAKEVGGDFYDFFLTDDGSLCLIIADVAGKGIPAALFMMIAKALIKNRLKSGDSPAEALSNVNEQICEYNIGNMFVTTWLAKIDLSTGRGTEVNAGHEHPVIRRKGERFELNKYRHGLAIGVMSGTKFTERPIELNDGDMLFVYTDGLPEATDKDDEMFGVKRMMDTVNERKETNPHDLLIYVRDTVGEFVGEREPFDDLTMLSIKWGE
ncbi:MAG: serine/threonine-protein phosphatase [Lachnospiraceae bacterium]|nr:serine/threonine-protein phosphatase [Lachnospiraceae bacterium]